MSLVSGWRFSMAELLAFLCGVVAFSYGVHFLIKSYKLTKNGVSALGVVTELKPNRRKWGTCHPIISFKPHKGRRVEFEYKFSFTFGPVFYLDQPIAIRYDPNDPREATIDSILLMWALPIILCLFGIGFPALAILGPRWL
jgi:hypothetical protein